MRSLLWKRSGWSPIWSRISRRHHAGPYVNWVRYLRRSLPRDAAMQAAVGGGFAAIGMLEREILVHAGLPKDGYVIDVGCGSGRLAAPLADYLSSGRYLGLDIVPDLLEYASERIAKPSFRFRLTDGRSIPEGDGVADIVCFFSVFTHLLHEESYHYLAEASRVLKMSGRIIFSFLEFRIPSHWTVFEDTLRNTNQNAPLNVFMGRDAIEAWARHLDLHVAGIWDGDKPPVSLGAGSLGQSVCILAKTG